MNLGQLLLAALMLGAPGNPGVPAPPKGAGGWNVVFVLVDDLGWADLGCYGHRWHETPRVDQLAREGIRFTDAYAACPVCSPTRASVLTGKYPARLNLTDFIPGHLRPWARLIPPRFNQQLPLEEVTVAEVLRKRGYATAAFGKWHLGPRPYFPDHQGFDRFVVTFGRHFRFRTVPPQTVPPGTPQADFLTEQAVQFIRQHRNRPFFLYLSYYLVHIPLEADPQRVQYFQNKPKPDQGIYNPTYAAMLESLDRNVGRLLDELDRLGLREQTVVIFTSDNGGLRQRFDGQGPLVTSNHPLRGEKGSLYEGGIRVPAIVRWPGVVQPGRVCQVPICSVDWLPTVAHLAGAQVPEGVDGVSLVPVLQGAEHLGREALFWHYPHYHHSTPGGAVRWGRYKLIEFYEDGRLELYDLREDLGEQHNLAEQKPRLAWFLRDLLHRWRAQVGARMPELNPNYDPQRAHLWGRRPRRRPRQRPASQKTSPNQTS